MQSLISAENTWGLMAVTCGWVAFTIYAEQKWAWAARLSGCMLALLGAMLLTNLRIIPSNAPWFDDAIWGYAVPLAIPLLLLQCDIRKIWRESGRLLLLFLIGSIGTAFSAWLGFALLHPRIENLAQVAAMMTGSYIGGTVNLVALADAFAVPKGTVSAVVVADNLLMSVYFFVLIAIAGMKCFRRAFTHPQIDRAEAHAAGDGTQAAEYWKGKPISLRDIALNLAISAGIVALGSEIAERLGAWLPQDGFFWGFLSSLLGNRYLILTTMTMLLATFFSGRLAGLSGAQELGTYLIYLFFFAIGAPASLGAILQNAPLLFVFCAIMVLGNMLFVFGFGKLLRFHLEDCILASNANIGGPTTAAAMAVSQGWTELIAPVLLIGTMGYAIGTYFGLLIGQLLGA